MEEVDQQGGRYEMGEGQRDEWDEQMQGYLRSERDKGVEDVEGK